MWSDDIESWQQIWSDVVSVLLSKTPDPLLQPLKTPIHNFCTLTVTIFTSLLSSESETNHWWRNVISILWMLELKKIKNMLLLSRLFWHRYFLHRMCVVWPGDILINYKKNRASASNQYKIFLWISMNFNVLYKCYMLDISKRKMCKINVQCWTVVVASV